jgi:putative sterol carrier protein
LTTKEEIIEAVQRMVAKIEDPKLEKRFRNFDRIMLMTYTDLGVDVIVEFKDGKATVSEGTPDAPHMTIITDTATILGILDGTKSAMRSFMGGKVKAEGPTRDLMKLQSLLKSS